MEGHQQGHVKLLDLLAKTSERVKVTIRYCAKTTPYFHTRHLLSFCAFAYFHLSLSTISISCSMSCFSQI